MEWRSTSARRGPGSNDDDDEDDDDDDDDNDDHDVHDDDVPDVEPECVVGAEAGEQGVDDPQLEEVETYNQDVCPGHLVECHQVVSRQIYYYKDS